MPNMKFLPLASSSAGNAYLLSSGETNLLLECGITVRELRRRLGGTLPPLRACLVTHEHGDHSKAAKQLLHLGIPVYMSYGTAFAHKDNMDEARLIAAGEAVQLGGLRVLAFRVFHNTEEPLGWLIEDSRTGERLLFAIDTVNLNYIAPRLNFVALECNYAAEIMNRSPDTNQNFRFRKERTKRCHMEVGTALRYLRKLDLSKCRGIYLMHLSDAYSDANAFQEQFERAFPGIQITICPK